MSSAMRGRAGVPSARARSVSAVAGAVALAGLAGLGGCFTSSEGLEPPLTEFYYPTGLVVSPGGTTLYVANSDFDLQYNGGTVQALDLGGPAGLRATVAPLAEALRGGLDAATACSNVGLLPNENRILNPGPCNAFVSKTFVQSYATIGAFASAAILVHNPDLAVGGARLMVPVRGDPSVTYFDVVDDRPESGAPKGGFTLSCGGTGTQLRCDPAHRIGEDPQQSQRKISLLPEPVGIAATETGTEIAITHQTEQAASLVVNAWPPLGGAASPPTLEFTLRELPVGPTEVIAVPVPRRARAAGFRYSPGFMVTFREAAEIDLLRYQSDSVSGAPRPFLSRVAAIGITTNTSGADSRGIAIDASERQACEATCADDGACLETCAEIPLGLYVANRAPASLLVGTIKTQLEETDGVITGATDIASLYETVPLSFGASRLAMGRVINEAGLLEPRVFAVAFDTRLVFSYDPQARRIESVIHTGRGPHAITFDTDPLGGFSYLIIGHFTDSYLGVVDLDMRRPQTFGQMFATVGTPRPPQESK